MGKNEQGSGNSKLPWGIVIFSFILFWPLGDYLTWKKIRDDKQAVLKNNKWLNYVGLILIVLGMIMAVILYVKFEFRPPQLSELETVAFLSFFFGGGLGLILARAYLKKAARIHRIFISLVVNQKVESINEMSVASLLSENKAYRQLLNMMEMGYFTGGQFDYEQNEFFLPERVWTEAPSLCSLCGAENTRIAGAKGNVCGICGSAAN